MPPGSAKPSSRLAMACCSWTAHSTANKLAVGFEDLGLLGAAKLNYSALQD